MDEVKVWKEDVVIPTYEVGAPDKNPMFLEKRVYQGSSGRIYPYPATQEIAREKTDHVWHAVFLENRYLKIMILPELGGRIQRALDKTTGYDFVYYNHVIKPALVGLTGPWISGGIEFNWPQHHRPTTYCPVDCEFREDADGRKTVLLGDVDQMYGTKVVTGISLLPDAAYIEITARLYNRTPLPQTFLWWANPAVAVNDETQSIFPPDVANVYDHGKRAVSRFPIATGEYYKHDYSEGVDISRYKNIPVPTSYMAERSEYDFVGGYDYGKKEGLLHVADHHVSPGKKQWTWGCGDFGRAWDRQLTDSDGPYVELMTGMYCDNQPDFTWLMPFEEKTFTQYFMPYRAVGSVKNASKDAALNLEKRGDTVFLCVYASGVFSDAEIVLTAGSKELFRKKAALSPTEIFETTVPEVKVASTELCATVYANGKVLVSYREKPRKETKIAEPAKAPSRPEETRTNEELFLTAQHLEQYRHATWLPDDYYLEALKRDPEDIRCNHAYGKLLLRRGCFAESETYFQRAIRRLTGDGMFNNPYDGEAFYNLGLSYFYQGRYDEAYDAFYKATWTNAEQEMSFYYLAAIAARRKDWESVLSFLEKSLLKNAHNVKALGLKAIALRCLGDADRAKQQLTENLALDPFDLVSRFESENSISGGHEHYLQTARDYLEWGCYEEAARVLTGCPEEYPMIFYYLAYALEKTNDTDGARKAYEHAEACDPAYCFPNKLEDIIVLTAAIASSEENSFASYYLGCLFYDKLQFDRAISLWEQAERRLQNFPTLYRNLAIAYYNKRKDGTKARELMEKAFSLNETDAQVFLERDALYQRLGVDAKERLLAYETHLELLPNRDDLYTEYVTLLNLCGKYQDALDAIQMHSFRAWEGAEGKISTQFKLSLLSLARKALQNGDAAHTETLLREALSYPENLGEGRLEGTTDNHLYYTLGLALEAQGTIDAAKECYQKATRGISEPAGMLYYYDQPADMILYQGLAYRRLGRKKEANARFYKLLDYGERHLFDVIGMDYFAVSLPDLSVFDADLQKKHEAHCHYLMGLGKLGLGENLEAVRCFRKAREYEPTHQLCTVYERMIENESNISGI